MLFIVNCTIVIPKQWPRVEQSLLQVYLGGVWICWCILSISVCMCMWRVLTFFTSPDFLVAVWVSWSTSLPVARDGQQNPRFHEEWPLHYSPCHVYHPLPLPDQVRIDCYLQLMSPNSTVCTVKWKLNCIKFCYVCYFRRNSEILIINIYSEILFIHIHIYWLPFFVSV